MQAFLRPLHVDADLVRRLSGEFCTTFQSLAAESSQQFLPTPISESLLRRAESGGRGRYLAIDIGGTNLRAGFVELLGDEEDDAAAAAAAAAGAEAPPKADGDTDGAAADGIPAPARPRRLRRLLEQSWPIGEHLKNENPADLFLWIGRRVAAVVREGCAAFGLDPAGELPLGVTFSFPMVQRSLHEATLMPMGKGFAITSELDLASHLLQGYEAARAGRGPPLPRIRVAAIANDAVATLVSLLYQFPTSVRRKAAMGLICGTGSNATIPLKLSSLHRDKRPHAVSVVPGQHDDERGAVRIAVNTEWSINGSAGPLRRLGLVSRWDEALDAAGEMPGFQPLEYMTAGRYLGELGRLVLLDYMGTALGVPAAALPARMRRRFGLTTTFLSHYSPSRGGMLREQLAGGFPPDQGASFEWTDEAAEALYQIARAIELRAAGIVAAATVGLLACAEELQLSGPGERAALAARRGPARELVVGYTGGCIVHFQNYLADCQRFLDDVASSAATADGGQPVRVLLSPCHDGGLTGAAILVPASLASRKV